MTVGVHDMPLENIHLDIMIILNCRHLKSSKYREKLSLNFLYLPKGKSSKRNVIVIDLLPRSFTNQGRLLLSQERRLEINITPRQICYKLPTSHLFIKVSIHLS